MAKPILGHPTKKAALAHIRAIRDKYKVLEIERKAGDPHIPLTGKDAEFITALLLMHPHAAKIIGPGIDYHYVAQDDTRSRDGWGFRTVRIDGTEDAWSMHNALNAKMPTDEARAKVALRREVDDWCKREVAKYDRGPHGGTCYRTGEPILDDHDTDIHHAGDWPFHQVVIEFMRDERLGWSDIKVEDPCDSRGRVLTGVRCLVDRELAERFVAYHAERAQIVRVLKADHKEETKEEGERRRSGYYVRQDFEPLTDEVDIRLTDYQMRILRTLTEGPHDTHTISRLVDPGNVGEPRVKRCLRTLAAKEVVKISNDHKRYGRVEFVAELTEAGSRALWRAMIGEAA